MILTQVLATLHKKPQSDINANLLWPSTTLKRARKTREMLGHFMNVLGPARGMAAASVGEAVLLSEDLTSATTQCAGTSGEDPVYSAFEVPYPHAPPFETVREEKRAQSRTEQIRDIIAAVGQHDVEAAENLVVLRTLPWIRHRMNAKHIFRHPDPPQDHILIILASLRPRLDETKLSFTVAADLFELPVGTTLDSEDEVHHTWTVSLSALDVFRELELKLQDVFNGLREYDEAAAASRDQRLTAFYDFVLALARLDETVHNSVFESRALFNSEAMAEAAETHVKERRSLETQVPEEDDDEPLTCGTHQLGMRVLHLIRKITQPIRSLHILMNPTLRKLVDAGALRIYTIHQTHAVPRISVQDILAFRAQFKITDPGQRCALDRLILRAFFSRDTLMRIAAHDAALSDLVQDLDNLAGRDKQAWPASNIGSQSNSDYCVSEGGTSAMSGLTHCSGVSGVREKVISSNVDLYTAMWDAIQIDCTLVGCNASRHAESLLMVALHTAKAHLSAEQVYTVSRMPCFCCKWVSETLGNPLPPSHGIIFPWIPPCGMSFDKLQRLERVLVEKLKGKAHSRGSHGTTASAARALPAFQIPRHSDIGRSLQVPSSLGLGLSILAVSS